MHEEFIIRNFGPLKDIYLPELRPVMVFVGASGSGKSLLLKVLAMVRHIAKKAIIREALKSSGVKRTPFRLRLDTYLQFSGFEALLQHDTEIRYLLRWDGKRSCEVVLDKAHGLKVSMVSQAASPGPFLKIAFVSDLRNLVAAWGQRSSLAQQSRTLDSHFAETLDLWEEARDALKDTDLTLDFLKATVSREKQNGDRPRVFVKTPDGRRTPLEKGASGYRSSIPLALILRYLVQSYDFSAAIKRSYLETLLNDLMAQSQGNSLPKTQKIQRFSGNFLCILVEEPELSLDPDTQILLAEELMGVLAQKRTDQSAPETSLLFTTHSPYWIVALNTILTEKSCSALTWEKLGGYWITPEGNLKDLRDEEAQLLATPNMDEATQGLDARYNLAVSQEERG